MASEKVSRILKAKSPFAPSQISIMSDSEGWAWIYANAKPIKEKLTQVCFTGFSTADKEDLINLAKEANLEVVGSVTRNLAFLCAGENAGPKKLQKAKEQGVHILSKDQFFHLIETGEILV